MNSTRWKAIQNADTMFYLPEVENDACLCTTSESLPLRDKVAPTQKQQNEIWIIHQSIKKYNFFNWI